MSKADAMKKFLSDESMRSHPEKHDYAMSMLYSALTKLLVQEAEAEAEAKKQAEDLDRLIETLDKAGEIDLIAFYICHQTDQWA